MAYVKPLTKFYCQKILPLIYDDSLSYYELLCKVVEKLNELVGSANDFDAVVNAAKEELYAALATETGKLNAAISAGDQALADQIKSNVDTLNGELTEIRNTVEGNYSALEAQIKVLQDWIDNYDENMWRKFIEEILNTYVPSQMTVSLSQEGHLVIDYWEPWDELVFGTTGYDVDVPIQPEFGHLTVSY